MRQMLIMLVLVIAFAVSANAGVVAHWRLGENDAGNLGIGDSPQAGAGAIVDETTNYGGEIDYLTTTFSGTYAAGHNLGGGAISSSLSLGFDGVDDNVRIPHGGYTGLETFPLQNFTIEAFVKTLTGDTTRNVVFGSYNSENSIAVNFEVQDDGQLELYVRMGGVGRWVIGGAVGALNDGDWHHVAGTYSPASAVGVYDGTLELFIDGISVATNTHDRGAFTINEQMLIGDDRRLTTTPFSGWIDEVRISDTILDTSEFLNVATDPSAADSPVAWWMFDESVGTIVLDSTYNGNDGDLQNGPVFQPADGKYRGALTFDGVNDFVDCMATKIKFGAIADVHHTVYPKSYPNIGDNSARIAAFSADMDSEDANFVVYLGDNVHNLDNVGLLTETEFLQNIDSFKTYAGVFSGSVYPVLGNHDVLCASKADTISHLHDPSAEVYMPASYHYFDRPSQNLRFIVLDGEYNLDGSDKGPGDPDFSEGYVPPVEQIWLTNTLNDANALGYEAVVFSHQRLEIMGSYGTNNSSTITGIIEDSGIVSLVLQGHAHENSHVVQNGVNYLTFYSPAGHDSDPDNANDWAMVDIKNNHAIVVAGHGEVTDTILGKLGITRSSSQVTMAAWIKLPTSLTTQADIFYEETSADGYTRLALGVTSDRKLTCGGRDTENGTYKSMTGTTILASEQWYHVMGVWDADNDFIHLYVDGGADEGGPIAIGNTTNSVSGSVAIGGQVYSTGSMHLMFEGSIDDLRIYSRLLSTDEIEYLADINLGDLLDGDGYVDWIDFASFASYWLEIDCIYCGRADLTKDGNVTMEDMGEFAERWLVEY